jgi:hypothetical protein
LVKYGLDVKKICLGSASGTVEKRENEEKL